MLFNIPVTRWELVDGDAPWNGRLELIKNGVRGTVCDDAFGEEEVTVACRSLGFK